METTQIEIDSGYWFMPKMKVEAIREEVIKSDDCFAHTLEVKYQTLPDTFEDLTDYSFRARMLRWLFNKVPGFSWLYSRVIKG